ncbi:universal stress protein [Halopenitus sp. H-Gu1]|uniref:universal stress protein n=1 Tax=Halopenitus sp. H-Gu1 TaxID=3242697 RepID=UPI00359EB4DB
MYDQILVATDGSDGSTKAITEALGLADLSDATLHALYVVDTRDYSTLPESKWLTIEDQLTEQGERAVGAVEHLGTEGGVETVTAITRGIPHEEILAYVDQHAIDLIVIGTHGRTGLNHFLIGSVAEKVIRSADIPVHVVRINTEIDQA